MRKVPLTPPVKQKDLAQQKSDFTSEGAPVPGNVSTAPPLTPEDVEKAMLETREKDSETEKAIEKRAEKQAEKEAQAQTEKGAKNEFKKDLETPKDHPISEN